MPLSFFVFSPGFSMLFLPPFSFSKSQYTMQKSPLPINSRHPSLDSTLSPYPFSLSSFPPRGIQDQDCTTTIHVRSRYSRFFALEAARTNHPVILYQSKVGTYFNSRVEARYPFVASGWHLSHMMIRKRIAKFIILCLCFANSL